MKNVYYFQRYSQKENWVTNNTLLLLSRLYQLNRLKFEKVLNAILADNNLSLQIGVKFLQQQRAKNSVPDGVMEQSNFKLVIETKLYDNFESDQIIRHFDAFENSGEKILLALSKNEISKEQRREINQHLKSSDKDVKFASTSFEKLTKIIKENLSDYELEMNEILDDFINFCEESDLVNRTDQTLLVFTAGQSLKENLKYNIYYDSDTRNHNLPFKYIGLYDSKTVVAIGELKKIVYCEYDNGTLKSSTDEPLILDNDEVERIKEIIEVTDYYDLTKGTKFFLVDKFISTNYKKISWSSLRMKRYFFLDEIEGYKNTFTTNDIADFLKDKEWE